jgi:hypothetical protein
VFSLEFSANGKQALSDFAKPQRIQSLAAKTPSQVAPKGEKEMSWSVTA